MSYIHLTNHPDAIQSWNRSRNWRWSAFYCIRTRRINLK